MIERKVIYKMEVKVENVPANNENNPDNNGWDSLTTGYDAIEQNLQDDLAQIEEDFQKGKIDQTKHDAWVEDVNAAAARARSEEAELQQKLEKMENRTEEDEFAGERNINDATGKERTRSFFDLYPRLKGEPFDVYKARIQRIHELNEQLKTEKIDADQHEKEITDAAENEAIDASETEQEGALESEQLSDDEIEKLEKNLREAEKKLREEEQEKATIERMEELKTELGDLRSKLAELAARNRRLIIGSKNRAEYNEVKREYNAKLDEYLRIADKAEYNKEFRANNKHLQAKFDAMKDDIEAGVAEFAGGDIKNTDKSPEEIEAERQRLIKIAEKMLDQEYDELKQGLKTKVNVAHLERFIEQDSLLREATNESIDNGSVWRRAVSKILTNKYIKGALIGAAVAGLAVTGVGLAAGLAAGTTTVGIGLGAGTAWGAVKGGLSGLLMSRQSSKNSALNVEDRATREQNIREQLKDMDFLADNSDAENVTKWMLEQYDSAIQSDHASNRKRTIIATSIGAAAGAIMGSLQFNSASPNTADNVSNSTANTANTAPATETRVVGYDVSDNLGNINVSEGSGMYESLTQMGVAPEDVDRAIDLAFQLDKTYGLSPGSNGEIPGFDGIIGDYAHTYPGNIEGWPDVVQDYYYELAQILAKEGLINADPITIEVPGVSPIFNTPTEVAAEAVPDAFSPFLNTATEWIPFTVGAIPGAFATRQNRSKPVEAPKPTPVTPESTADDDAEETPAETSNETSSPIQPENSTPAPEQQPEQEPEQTSTTPEQTPAESEQNTAEQSNENQALRDLITSNLGNLLSEEDINMLTKPNVSDEGERDNGFNDLESWWDSLNDDKKNTIRQFYQNEASNALLTESLFKLYLDQNPEEAAPAAAPQPSTESTPGAAQ